MKTLEDNSIKPKVLWTLLDPLNRSSANKEKPATPACIFREYDQADPCIKINY